jgi:hypothetical protein
MMSEVVKYEVYNRKGDWMGGYSLELERANPSINCLDMAKQNAYQCQGKVIAVSSDGSEKKVYPEK